LGIDQGELVVGGDGLPFCTGWYAKVKLEVGMHRIARDCETAADGVDARVHVKSAENKEGDEAAAVELRDRQRERKFASGMGWP
jgi:hypothetical protein